MARRIVVFAFVVLFLGVPAMAQTSYTGSLFVTIQDEDGTAISGAAVKLIGADRTREATSDANGGARFIGLDPGKYDLEVANSGYNTMVYTDLEVDTLANVQMSISLQKSTTVERVVVTAETPLVDVRKIGTQTVLTQEEMTSIPNARDPWAVLQTVPGVTSDRINVGGNEAGQQANFVGRGDDGEGSTWVMDGVDITDNAAEGATQSYLDFNAFEQISFVTTGADIEQSAPGVRLNFVQKQGSNRHTGTLRMIYTDNDLQDDTVRDGVENPITGLKSTVSGNGVTELFEKNFDLGGPLVKDKLWYWIGFTQNDINTFLANTGTQDITKLQNKSAKLHGQAGGATSYKLYWTVGDKGKDGRTAVPNRSVETTWVQSGPSPIRSASISHFFTPNFEVNAQINEVDGGFALSPKAGSDPGTQIIVDESGTWTNTFIDFSTDRPTDQYLIRGNYFKTLGGWDHEFKFGFKLKDTQRSSTSLYGGDGVLAFEGPGGMGGSAYLYRIGDFTDETTHINAWIGDTLLKGNWAINVGLHYSVQDGEQLAGTVPGNPLLSNPAMGGIPNLDFGGFNPNVEWSNVLPRAGFTYTFPGEHRVVVRAGYAQYVDSLSNGDIGFNNPVAPSAVGYPWDDLNGDNLVSVNELDTATLLGTTNFDPMNPNSASSPDAIDSNMDGPTVDEFTAGAEYEVARNFSVAANVTMRERKDELWAPLFDVNQFDSQTQTGTLVTLPPSIYTCANQSGMFAIGNRTYDEPVCTITDVSDTSLARPTYLTNQPGLSQDYMSLELSATKRLSNRWMLRGFLTFVNWEKNFSGTPVTNGIFDAPPSSSFVVPDGDPTNLAGDTTVDGSDVAFQAGGSGPTSDIWPGSSTWQFNVNGLYQLPMGVTLSANVTGREGYSIPVMFINSAPDADGITAKKSVQIDGFGDDRYDDIFLVDFKVNKLFTFGNDTTVDIAAEIFNLFNDDTVLATARAVDNGQGAPFGTINQVVSPRIVRFSASVRF